MPGVKVNPFSDYWPKVGTFRGYSGANRGRFAGLFGGFIPVAVQSGSMADSDSTRNGGCIPREQVEVALHLMEEFHGDALRRPWSDEAHAYYHAVEAIEDALNEKLDPNASHRLMNVRRSRRAREEGYAKATLLDEAHDTNKSEPQTITQKIIEFFQ